MRSHHRRPRPIRLRPLRLFFLCELSAFAEIGFFTPRRKARQEKAPSVLSAPSASLREKIFYPLSFASFAPLRESVFSSPRVPCNQKESSIEALLTVFSCAGNVVFAVDLNFRRRETLAATDYKDGVDGRLWDRSHKITGRADSDDRRARGYQRIVHRKRGAADALKAVLMIPLETVRFTSGPV